jgi:hypothetical protein
MAVDDAEEYRRQAAECRRQAARAVSEVQKAEWLRLAQDWLSLANGAEERKRRAPPGTQVPSKSRDPAVILRN